jgi:hypothetical protein
VGGSILGIRDIRVSENGMVEIACMEVYFDQSKNVVPNYVPILFEENALKTIWIRGLIGLHRVDGCRHLWTNVIVLSVAYLRFNCNFVNWSTHCTLLFVIYGMSYFIPW